MSFKCTAFLATSLDGYIARPDGGIDWLEKPEYDHQEELAVTYEQFIATVDSLVLGRNSFEKVLSFGVWPYEIPVVVLTSRELEIPAHLAGKVQLDRGQPAEIAARLAAKGNNHLYIDGGITIQRFLAAKLITDLIITTAPVLIGSGIPLFGHLESDVNLQHQQTTSASNGLVQSHYRVEYTTN